MNKVDLADIDPASIQLADIQSLPIGELQHEFISERERCIALERDLFKSQTENRRLGSQIKTLQELNTLNAKNRNNTSSSFTLPSEFKQAWDELVKESILDAFPDFLDNYEELVPLVQELFIFIREEIIQIQRSILVDIAKRLNLLDPSVGAQDQEKIIGHLETKFQSVFQEYSLQIFSMADEKIDQILQERYKPRCEGIVSERDGAMDDFEDNISTPDFKRFFRSVMKLQLHMVLNDPPIQLSMDAWEQRKQKQHLVEKFEFWMFNKNDYYCIDGFPKEGYPCIVVLPPPYRSGYVYQGIKPAVIVLNSPSEELREHVRVKQEELLEKLKLKRQISLGVNEEELKHQNEETYKQPPMIQPEQEAGQTTNAQDNTKKDANESEPEIIEEEPAEERLSSKSQIEETFTPDKRLQSDKYGQHHQIGDSTEAKGEFPKQSPFKPKRSSKKNTSTKKKSKSGSSKKTPSIKSNSDNKKQMEETQHIEDCLSEVKMNQRDQFACASPTKTASQLSQAVQKSKNHSSNKKEQSSSKKRQQPDLSSILYPSEAQQQQLIQPVMCDTYKQLRLKNEPLKNDKENHLSHAQSSSNKINTVPAIKEFEKAIKDGANNQSVQRVNEQRSEQDNASSYEGVDLSSQRRLKSPLQLKDKLQDLYHEYLNVKQKTHASQVVSTKLTDEQQVLSARRRTSNNYQHVSNGSKGFKYSESRNNEGNLLAETRTNDSHQEPPPKYQLNESQTIKCNIQNQIKKLAETMKGQPSGSSGSKLNQQSTSSLGPYPSQDQPSKVPSSKISAKLRPSAEYMRCYEMPKKITSESQKKATALQQQSKSIIVAAVPTNHSTNSIISEMHIQNGMNSIKKDLQRKIQNYQSILKKTYNDKKYPQQPNLQQQNQSKSPFDYNKFASLDQHPSKAGISQVTKPGQGTPNSDTCKSSRNTYQNKIENLQSLKNSFFSKIHTLNQKLEQDKVQAQQERLSSRSKSPLQKNMPRQQIHSSKQLNRNPAKCVTSSGLQRKTTLNFDDSSDSEDDLNTRQQDHHAYPQNKDLSASVKDYKRARRQDVNFKSLNRKTNGQNNGMLHNECRVESQNQEQAASPQPCVTYRGGFNTSVNGRVGTISNCSVQTNGVHAHRPKVQ